MELPPCKKCDPEGIKERIGLMFKYCEENDRRPTVELLSVFVGVSRTTLWQWEQDEHSEAGRIVARAKAAINAIITEIEEKRMMEDEQDDVQIKYGSAGKAALEAIGRKH